MYGSSPAIVATSLGVYTSSGNPLSAIKSHPSELTPFTEQLRKTSFVSFFSVLRISMIELVIDYLTKQITNCAINPICHLPITIS